MAGELRAYLIVRSALPNQGHSRAEFGFTTGSVTRNVALDEDTMRCVEQVSAPFPRCQFQGQEIQHRKRHLRRQVAFALQPRQHSAGRMKGRRRNAVFVRPDDVKVGLRLRILYLAVRAAQPELPAPRIAAYPGAYPAFRETGANELKRGGRIAVEDK